MKGDGCTLNQLRPYGTLPVEAMREIAAEPGATCTLLVGRGHPSKGFVAALCVAAKKCRSQQPRWVCGSLSVSL